MVFEHAAIGRRCLNRAREHVGCKQDTEVELCILEAHLLTVCI